MRLLAHWGGTKKKRACRLYLATPPAGAVILSRQVVPLPLPLLYCCHQIPIATRCQDCCCFGNWTSLTGRIARLFLCSIVSGRASITTLPFAEVWTLTQQWYVRSLLSTRWPICTGSPVLNIPSTQHCSQTSRYVPCLGHVYIKYVVHYS